AGQEVVTSLVTACMANFKPKMPESFKPENIPEGFKQSDIPDGSDFKIPTGGFGPSGDDIPTGAGITPPTGIYTPPSGAVPSINCSNFAAVTSCSYVPEGVRSQCEQCKGND
ncbi:MAG: hypothetical protein WA057_05920, partial [Candidatus Magasanikiibacteriota bacterium]